MKKHFPWLSSVACFTMLSSSLVALPQNPSVVSGDVQIHQKSHEMSIHASDRSIIDYKSFDIRKGEKVRFVQPSSSSYVLNRVKGDKASKILGSMESNGKVLLVNPNGMYFGPHASVRTASLIASTLDIANEDFLKGKYFFSLQKKGHFSQIRNDGVLEAAPEGCVVLMASQIRNEGTINAPSGQVVLAAGEQVTLDFHGDRLLQFAVEGDVKDAILEHLGTIKAEGGEVSMRLPTAKKAIREVVNHEGAEKGEMFVKQNGEIFLVSKSSIIATNVDVEGSVLSVEGKIDVSNPHKQGGSVHLSGAEISLKGAHIDASGKTGGGKVLVGGEVQGQGTMPHAASVFMDEHSQILANATEDGHGGNVVLWSRQNTDFEGKIFAQGGSLQGNGGFVETSGLESLSTLQGYVSTFAQNGQMGQWLLDPTTLNVVAGASANPGCSGGSVGVDSFTSSTSNVVLCSTFINVQVDTIAMTVEESGLFFTSPPNEAGILHLQGGVGPVISITTAKGAIAVTNMDMLIDKYTIIDTTTSGAYPIGAGIILQDVDATDSGISLGLFAGTGKISVGNIGVTTPLNNVNISADIIYAQSVFTQGGGEIHFFAPVVLKEDSIFSTEDGGGDITLDAVDSVRPGVVSLAIRAGTGNVFIEGVGENSPMGNFSILSAADGVITGNIITQNGIVEIVPSLQLVKPRTIIKTFSDLNSLLSGPIILGDIDPSIHATESLSLLTGLKGLVTVGNVGSEDFYLKNLSVETNQPFTIQNVFANNVSINALSGTVLLDGSMVLSGDLSIPDAASITLGGPISADSVFMKSRDSILNEGIPYTITVPSTGSTYLNASRGDIGTPSSPVSLDTEGSVTVGGATVNLIGVYPPLEYVVGNRPCLVLFRGELLACALARQDIFRSLPKATFVRTFHFNPVSLGLGFPARWYNNMQYSPFSPINPISGNLPEFDPSLVRPL